MPTAVRVETSRERQPCLWGVRTTQGTERAPSERPPRKSERALWAGLATFGATVEYQEEKETTSLVGQIHALLQQLQSLGVRHEKREAIREYLLKFPGLIDVVPQAVHGVLRYFPEARLFLDVYRDPEMKDEYLILYVRLQTYDASVSERIEAAEKEFIGLLAEKEGWLQVSTDFRGLGG